MEESPAGSQSNGDLTPTGTTMASTGTTMAPTDKEDNCARENPSSTVTSQATGMTDRPKGQARMSASPLKTVNNVKRTARKTVSTAKLEFKSKSDDLTGESDKDDKAILIKDRIKTMTFNYGKIAPLLDKKTKKSATSTGGSGKNSGASENGTSSDEIGSSVVSTPPKATCASVTSLKNPLDEKEKTSETPNDKKITNNKLSPSKRFLASLGESKEEAYLKPKVETKTDKVSSTSANSEKQSSTWEFLSSLEGSKTIKKILEVKPKKNLKLASSAGSERVGVSTRSNSPARKVDLVEENAGKVKEHKRRRRKRSYLLPSELAKLKAKKKRMEEEAEESDTDDTEETDSNAGSTKCIQEIRDKIEETKPTEEDNGGVVTLKRNKVLPKRFRNSPQPEKIKATSKRVSLQPEEIKATSKRVEPNKFEEAKTSISKVSLTKASTVTGTSQSSTNTSHGTSIIAGLLRTSSSINCLVPSTQHTASTVNQVKIASNAPVAPTGPEVTKVTTPSIPSLKCDVSHPKKFIDNWGILVDKSKTLADVLMESRSKRLSAEGTVVRKVAHKADVHFTKRSRSLGLQEKGGYLTESLSDSEFSKESEASESSRQSIRLKRKYGENIGSIKRKRLCSSALNETKNVTLSELQQRIKEDILTKNDANSAPPADLDKIQKTEKEIQNEKDKEDPLPSVSSEDKIDKIDVTSTNNAVSNDNNGGTAVSVSVSTEDVTMEKAAKHLEDGISTQIDYEQAIDIDQSPVMIESADKESPCADSKEKSAPSSNEAFVSPASPKTNTKKAVDFSKSPNSEKFDKFLRKFKVTDPKIHSASDSAGNIPKNSFWFVDAKNKLFHHVDTVCVNTPQGITYPVTPPKTPEIPVSEKTVDSSRDFIPLCACKVPGSASTNESHATYCEALDSMDDQVIGCYNKVSHSAIARPSVKIPFVAVCELHRIRMKRHQCCPTCGYFCSQGIFYHCKDEGSNAVHFYHKGCEVVRKGKPYCPHCGKKSLQKEIKLFINMPRIDNNSSSSAKTQMKKPIPKARMGHRVQKEKEAENQEIEEPMDLPPSVKQLLTGLPRNDLENIFAYLQVDKINEMLTNKKALPKNLYNPAKRGDLEKVIAMLINGSQPNKKHDECQGQTALHAAALLGHLSIAQVLVQAGASVTILDKELKTALMLATLNNHVDLVHFLVKAGSTLEAKDANGMMCLQLAAKYGNLDIVKYLLNKAKMNVNLQDDGGWTGLVWAAEHRHLKLVEYLLHLGADCNLRDKEENTGLHWAAYSGSMDIAEMFLNAGSNLESINEHGDRPLHVAARQGHYECVVLFLVRGAACEATNNEDQTAYMVCREKDSDMALALQINQQLRSCVSKLGPQQRLLHRDLSCGRENNPIICVNDIDNEDYPRDYHYVSENVEATPLNINKLISGLQYCQCSDDCSSSMNCVCGKNSVKCWYTKDGKLTEDFNMVESPLVFECNKACHCWTTCNNRVIQNGITCRLEVFRTHSRGWGCRPLLDIPKGAFVCEYVGELISDAEADRRQDDSYLFDLDNRDGETYCLDARRYGNVARFINHLCEPNLIPIKVFVDHQDLRFPRICMFANRDIKAGEEVGFDYGTKFWIIKWKQFTCACGNPRCKYSADRIQQTIVDFNQKHVEELDL